MQRVVFNETELTLTPAEFKILSHLVKNPNQSSFKRVFNEHYLGQAPWL